MIIDRSPLPDDLAEYLATNRSELVGFTEALVGHDTQNPPGRVVDDRVFRRSATDGGDAKVFRHEGVPTVEFQFGTRAAYGTDEHTTVATLERNATAYAMVPYGYAGAVRTD